MAEKKLNNGFGYGQIELNQCAFRRDGRIEAQCKIAGADYVENGMILAIDNTKHEVRYSAANDYMFGLNYTSEHMYDERLVGGLKYYKTDKDSFLPRLGYLAVGDKFTTNTVVYDDYYKFPKLILGVSVFNHPYNLFISELLDDFYNFPKSELGVSVF